MGKDIRWQQRFENLDKALDRLREALDGAAREPSYHLYQIALIGAFQFTLELCWKTMKVILLFEDVEHRFAQGDMSGDFLNSRTNSIGPV